MNRICAFLLGWVACWSIASAQADIVGNFTLSSNTTFSTVAPDVFNIGAANRTFNLQGFTATFSGSGDFQVNSRIAGTGDVVVNLSDPSKTVEFNTGNTYTGETFVTSGRLLLDTPSGNDNGILGDLFIGGGPNSAVVTRPSDFNNSLIGDTSDITINQNGVLEFNRSNNQGGGSLERWGSLTLNGGSIINISQSGLPTVGSVASMTLLASSIIDLGNWMSFLADDVSQSAWNPNAILTIKNWSLLEPVYLGGIDQQQLSQIRFETSQGLYFAREIGSGFIIPSVLVPETSTVFLIPLLGIAAFWSTRKNRKAFSEP